MKIDRLIQILLPHDEKFYKLFEEMTRLLLKASISLKKLPDADAATTHTLVKEIENLEHEADEVTHNIFGELNATFVTPFDREDIHELASSLDDVMDFINGSASRLTLYNVKADSQYMRKLMEIIQKTGRGYRERRFIPQRLQGFYLSSGSSRTDQRIRERSGFRIRARGGRPF